MNFHGLNQSNYFMIVDVVHQKENLQKTQLDLPDFPSQERVDEECCVKRNSIDFHRLL